MRRDNSIHPVHTAAPSRFLSANFQCLQIQLLPEACDLCFPRPGPVWFIRGAALALAQNRRRPIRPHLPSLALTCRCSDASLLPVRHAPLCPLMSRRSSAMNRRKERSPCAALDKLGSDDAREREREDMQISSRTHRSALSRSLLHCMGYFKMLASTLSTWWDYTVIESFVSDLSRICFVFLKERGGIVYYDASYCFTRCNIHVIL